jgi:hypothetical protein
MKKSDIRICFESKLMSCGPEKSFALLFFASSLVFIVFYNVEQTNPNIRNSGISNRHEYCHYNL